MSNFEDSPSVKAAVDAAREKGELVETPVEQPTEESASVIVQEAMQGIGLPAAWTQSESASSEGQGNPDQQAG